MLLLLYLFEEKKMLINLLVVSHFRLDNKSAGRQSVASNNTKPEGESDADSMAEYGEGDTGM